MILNGNPRIGIVRQCDLLCSFRVLRTPFRATYLEYILVYLSYLQHLGAYLQHFYNIVLYCEFFTIKAQNEPFFTAVGK